jgi:small subunit ribosomal protein S6
LESYEITYIVRPDLDEDQIRGVVDGVTNRITGSAGETIATFPWNPARRRLAYPINDFGDGFYVTTTFRFPQDGIKELERALRLNDNLLRFLIVQATELSIQQSQQRSQQAAARAAAAAEQQAAPAQAAPQAAQPQTEPAPSQAQTAPGEPEIAPEAVAPAGPESTPEAAPAVEVEVETQPAPQPAATVEE